MTEPRTIVLKKKLATGRKRVQKTLTEDRLPAATPAAGPLASPAAPAVDIEQFSKNIARMVEEGGKALAAYLKPREVV